MQNTSPPDSRRRYACRLADLPLELRLAGARLGAAEVNEDAEDLFAAAMFPDPGFVAWIAEPVSVPRIKHLLYHREARRRSRSGKKA